jgi:hypothetical protein
MAELLGLISSVVTVAQLATETVKHTKSFLQAHEEFEALQASPPSHSHCSMLPLLILAFTGTT